MMYTKIVKQKKLILILIVILGLIFISFAYLRYSDYRYFGRSLTFGSWVNYQDKNLAISYSYPDDLGWSVTQKGLTAIMNCPTPISIVGDKNQIYALSICKNPSKNNLDSLLNDSRYIKSNLTINGKKYTVLMTEEEQKDGIQTGRYVIADNNSYLFGLARPYGFETAVDHIFTKIIGSIKNL